MSGKPKTKMLSLRVTEEQFNYLEDMAKRIKKTTGFKINRASIILKLIEYGLPHLEREFPRPKSEDVKKMAS